MKFQLEVLVDLLSNLSDCCTAPVIGHSCFIFIPRFCLIKKKGPLLKVTEKKLIVSRGGSLPKSGDDSFDALTRGCEC